MTHELFPHQDILSTKHIKTLRKYKILYYVWEQRVGKTIASLLTVQKYCKKYNIENSILFVTGKRIIPDIEIDIEVLKKIQGKKFILNIDIINYESLHKIPVDHKYKFIIIDEPQTVGAFPKPNVRAKRLKEIVKDNLLILLSGTPSPETYSQLYHQFYVSENSPFKQWKDFYSWVRAGFVTPSSFPITGRMVTLYTKANIKKIDSYIKKIMVSYTQEDADFKQSKPIDIFRLVPMKKSTSKLMRVLLRDRYYKFEGFKGELICDTAVSLQQKIHQISSGTIIADHRKKYKTIIKTVYSPTERKKIEVEVKKSNRIYKILDESKVEFIKEEYKNKKIAIFYKFINEGKVLKDNFNTTTDQVEFNKSKDLVFISQFRAGSRGIDISTADLIIAYNIDFSYEIFSQFRQRISKREKDKQSEIHWLFTIDGIESKIYNKVIVKQDYTLKHFRGDYMKKNKKSKLNTEALIIKNAIYRHAKNLQSIRQWEVVYGIRESFVRCSLLKKKDFNSTIDSDDVKKVIYDFSILVQSIDNSDIKTLHFIKNKYIYSCLLEKEDFNTVFGKSTKWKKYK